MLMGSRDTNVARHPRATLAVASLLAVFLQSALIDPAAAEQPKATPSAMPQFQATDYLRARIGRAHV